MPGPWPALGAAGTGGDEVLESPGGHRLAQWRLEAGWEAYRAEAQR